MRSKRYKIEDDPQEYKDEHFCSLCGQHYNDLKRWDQLCLDQKKQNRKCSHKKYSRVRRVTMIGCGHHACYDCRIKSKKDKQLNFGCHVVGCSYMYVLDCCEEDYNFELQYYNNVDYVECVECAPGNKPPERVQRVRSGSSESEPSYSSFEK